MHALEWGVGGRRRKGGRRVLFSYQLHTDSLFLCAHFNSSPMTYGGAGIWLSLSLQPRCSDTFIYLHQGNAVVLSATFREFLFTALPVHGPSSPDTCSCCEADGTLRTLRTAWKFSICFLTREWRPVQQIIWLSFSHTCLWWKPPLLWCYLHLHAITSLCSISSRGPPHPNPSICPCPEPDG